MAKTRKKQTRSRAAGTEKVKVIVTKPRTLSSNDVDLALSECRGAIRAAIQRGPVNDRELDAFMAGFGGQFKSVLNPQGINWRNARPHVLYLASVIGTLAEFLVSCDPSKSKTVGSEHLNGALYIVSKFCKADLTTMKAAARDQRIIFCPAELAAAAWVIAAMTATV